MCRLVLGSVFLRDRGSRVHFARLNGAGLQAPVQLLIRCLASALWSAALRRWGAPQATRAFDLVQPYSLSAALAPLCGALSASPLRRFVKFRHALQELRSMGFPRTSISTSAKRRAPATKLQWGAPRTVLIERLGNAELLHGGRERAPTRPEHILHNSCLFMTSAIYDAYGLFLTSLYKL